MRQGPKAEFSIHDWFLHRSQILQKPIRPKNCHTLMSDLPAPNSETRFISSQFGRRSFVTKIKNWSVEDWSKWHLIEFMIGRIYNSSILGMTIDRNFSGLNILTLWSSNTFDQNYNRSRLEYDTIIRLHNRSTITIIYKNLYSHTLTIDCWNISRVQNGAMSHRWKCVRLYLIFVVAIVQSFLLFFGDNTEAPR